MKTRVNLTIEDGLLKNTKLFAKKKGISVSELVENYFRSITKPVKKPNIIDLIKSLETPAVDKDADLKDLYYSDRAKKYGF